MDESTPASPTASQSSVDLLRDERYLTSLLAEVTSRPPEEIREKLRRERWQIGSNVWDAMRQAGLKPYTWSDELISFYESTDAFLFESVVWNQTALKKQMRRWIIDFLNRDGGGPRRVLIYGDGPGCDVLRFAQAGHHVTYYEVSRRSVRFAQRLFADAEARRWKRLRRKTTGCRQRTTRSSVLTSWSTYHGR